RGGWDGWLISGTRAWMVGSYPESRLVCNNEGATPDYGEEGLRPIMDPNIATANRTHWLNHVEKLFVVVLHPDAWIVAFLEIGQQHGGRRG
ncbi:MAG: hypothetical protein JW829_05705, partial [Pirellulales bacterium]|nr:hypothetical protein [Pirellulales bacterium]